jgi:hypothetical protein
MQCPSVTREPSRAARARPTIGEDQTWRMRVGKTPAAGYVIEPLVSIADLCLCALWLGSDVSERPCSSAALGVLAIESFTPPWQKKLPWSHCGLVCSA